MSGDSLRLSFPLSQYASDSGEASTLYLELRKPLLRYLVCLGLTSDEAQDAIQDAFLKLHRHLAGGGAQSNIRSWLFRVAHNQARNRQSSYERRFSAPLDAEIEAIPLAEAPDQAVLRAEKFKQLEEAMTLLSVAERECLLLRAQGLRYREIGEVLGIATSTVSDAVERAVKRLAEKCDV